MRKRGRDRRGGRTSLIGSAPLSSGNVITSVQDGSTPAVFQSKAHGLKAGASVMIVTNRNSYNGTKTVAASPAANSFSVSGVAYTGDATGYWVKV